MSFSNMAKIMKTPEEATENHLAGIVQAYLEGTITEAMLEGQVNISHSPETLKRVLELPRFSYLHKINPERLQHIKTKFLN